MDADDGSLILEYSRVSRGSPIPISRLVLGRPPRVGAMNSNNVLAAAMMIFGHLIEDDVSVNFNVSDEFVEAMSRVWKLRISVEATKFLERGAGATDDHGGRLLTISDDPSLLGRGDMDEGFLVILPRDKFYGSIGSMFSVALASNAGYESKRINETPNHPAAYLAVAVIWSVALNVRRFEISGDRFDLSKMTEKQISTLSMLGLVVNSR